MRPHDVAKQQAAGFLKEFGWGEPMDIGGMGWYPMARSLRTTLGEFSSETWKLECRSKNPQITESPHHPLQR